MTEVAERLKTTLTQLSARDVESVLNKQVKGLTGAQVHFDHGMLRVSGRFRGIPVRVAASVTLDDRKENMVARVRWLHVAHIPIPGWIFGKVHRQIVPLYPIPSLPGRIDLHAVSLENDVLTIS